MCNVSFDQYLPNVDSLKYQLFFYGKYVYLQTLFYVIENAVKRTQLFIKLYAQKIQLFTFKKTIQI